MRRSHHPAVILGIIPAEEFDKTAQNGVTDQIGGEDLAVEFLSAIKPGEEQVQTEIEQRFIDLGGMHRSPQRLVVKGKPDRPWQISRSSVAATRHQATDC